MRRLSEQVRDLLWPRRRRFGDCRGSRLYRELAQNPFAAAEEDSPKTAISPARRISGRESEERQIAWRPVSSFLLQSSYCLGRHLRRRPMEQTGECDGGRVVL